MEVPSSENVGRVYGEAVVLALGFKRSARGRVKQAAELPRGDDKRGHRHVEGRGDGAEEFGFGDEDLAIGPGDVSAGENRTLADGEARGGECVEGRVERAHVAVDGVTQRELVGDECDVGGTAGEGLGGGNGMVVGGVSHRGKHDGNFVDDGVEGIDLHDGIAGRAAEGERADEKFLQRELKGGHAAVDVDEFVEGSEEWVQGGGRELAKGGERELQEWEFVREAERGQGRCELVEGAQGVAPGAARHEAALAGARRGILIEEESVEEYLGFCGGLGGGAEAGRSGVEQELGVGDLVGCEGADGGDGGGGGCSGRVGEVGGARGLRGGEAGGDERIAGEVDDFGWGRHLAVELGIDGADAFVEGRVGGPEAAEVGAEALGEKEVADGTALVGLDGGTKSEAADFFQCAAEATGVARELDGGGVGEVFALS